MKQDDKLKDARARKQSDTEISNQMEEKANGNSDALLDGVPRESNGRTDDAETGGTPNGPVKIKTETITVESDNDGADCDRSSDQVIEPIATTRSRRQNAGSRMIDLILEEEDDFYNNLYGGFNEEDDDVDFNSNGEAIEDDDEDTDDESGSTSSSGETDDTAKEATSAKEENSNKRKKATKKSSSRPSAKPKPCTSRASSKSRPPRSKKLKAERTIAEFIKEEEQPDIKIQYKDCARICSVCLSSQSDEDDEIIECDSCGVTVHESCYGVSGTDDASHEVTSIHSDVSTESTEPWFCEPCRRSVYKPNCELCPNSGGIFKETDTGRWVHMVCALYTRGVTYENIQNLTDVSLFELNYSLYGSKACTICEDQRLAKSGVCIDCDAGLCKTFFHATCAQKEGLLFESHSDEVDPYFAQCKQHADKTVIKSKKRIYTALFARLKRAPSIEQRSDRIRRKLLEVTKLPHPQFDRWTLENPPPIPNKSSRMLLTSPSLIIRLTQKSELMGLDPTSTFMQVQDEIEAAKQKWHIPPAFNLEFVAYCLDRTTRMIAMKKKNSELICQNSALKRDEADLREKYNSIKDVVAKVRTENESMIREIRAIQKTFSAGNGQPFILSVPIEQAIARSQNTKSTNPPKAPKHSAAPPSTTHNCSKCKTTKDQHLLSLCDTCKCYFHIYCLDPPLARVPKKTKFGGWQCSDCSERDEEEQEEAFEEQNMLAIQEAEGPRKLRDRIKYPEKYCHESMLAANFWSASNRRKKKKSSKSARK